MNPFRRLPKHTCCIGPVLMSVSSRHRSAPALLTLLSILTVSSWGTSGKAYAAGAEAFPAEGCGNGVTNTLETHDMIWTPGAPGASSGSNLSKFRVIVNERQTGLSNSCFYGNTVYMNYETTEAEHLEDFVFVQFIRGCVFDTEERSDGSIGRTFTIGRDHFGRYLTAFHHPEWVVDTSTVDPAYSSPHSPDQPRHRHLRYYLAPEDEEGLAINHPEFGFERATRSYERSHGAEMPYPSLWARDIPTAAGYTARHRSATNTALEFRTCLYPASAVPRVSSPSRTDFGAAVHCFEWKQIRVHDPVTNTFTRDADIDAVCGAGYPQNGAGYLFGEKVRDLTP